MADIKAMTKGDLESVYEIVDSQNWGYFDEDIIRMIDFDPNGNFVLYVENKPIGVLFSSTYTEYAFIGPVIVNPEYRGQKLGKALMDHAIDYLEGRGVTSMELDSVFPATTLYRRHGFKDKYVSYRYRGFIAVSSEVIPQFLKPDMIDDMVEFDKKMTGLNREKHLCKFVEDFPDSILITGKDRIQGYALVRPRKGDQFWIGPMVAEDDFSGKMLFHSVINNHVGKVLSLGVPETNRFMIDSVKTRGFIHTIPALRMFRGKRLEYEQNVYAIIAPEKG
jgi:GNAT superfamily N-acetyltransferase